MPGQSRQRRQHVARNIVIQTNNFASSPRIEASDAIGSHQQGLRNSADLNLDGFLEIDREASTGDEEVAAAETADRAMVFDVAVDHAELHA